MEKRWDMALEIFLGKKMTSEKRIWPPSLSEGWHATLSSLPTIRFHS